MTALRYSLCFARSAAAGMIVALVLAAAVPVVFGGRTFTVMSGSMEPNVGTGDLVLTLPIRPAEAASGDVITFQAPGGDGRLLTHRVASSMPEGDDYRLRDQGRRQHRRRALGVPADGRIGRVVLRVPKVGYALALTRNPATRLALITLPALLLGGFALAAIWRRKEPADAAAIA